MHTYLNLSKHKDKRSYYTEKTKRIIIKTYYEDIKLFDYEFKTSGI